MQSRAPARLRVHAVRDLARMRSARRSTAVVFICMLYARKYVEVYHPHGRCLTAQASPPGESGLVISLTSDNTGGSLYYVLYSILLYYVFYLYYVLSYPGRHSRVRGGSVECAEALWRTRRHFSVGAL